MFTGNLTRNSNVFSTIHLNIRSLPKNNDQFMHFLSTLIVHNKYQIKVRKDLDLISNETKVESVFLELMSCPVFGGRNVIIGCIYHPPHAEMNYFNDTLTASLDGY